MLKVYIALLAQGELSIVYVRFSKRCRLKLKPVLSGLISRIEHIFSSNKHVFLWFDPVMICSQKNRRLISYDKVIH